MTNRNTINLQDLIPRYWNGIYISSEADLIFIGSKNLEYLKQYWQSEERSLAKQVKEARADIDLLAGKTPNDTCVECLKTRRASLVAKKRQAATYAGYLAEFMKKAEEKPHFAPHRPHDWANVGDRVMLLVSNSDQVIPEKANTFVAGTVIYDYRHHEGGVSVCSDTPWHTGDYCDGCGASFGIARPEILLEWEFVYLKEHPDYLKVWLRCAKAEFNKLDSEGYAKALLNA